MKSLIFDQLSVRSISQGLANRFVFSKTMNLVTAKDNSVGKTTLVKLLYWTLGCEVAFDTTWLSFDCESLLSFHVGQDSFLVSRYQNQIFFRNEKGESTNYEKITGKYSVDLSKVLGFELRLPNRNTGELEVPPPAFYFIPYYIDQKKSWSKALDNFGDLGQYADWQQNTLKYHVGLIREDYFEIERDIIVKREKKSGHLEKINTYEATVQIVEAIIPRNETIFDDQRVSDVVENLRENIQKLALEQEKLFTSIADTTDELTFLNQQRGLTVAMIAALGRDYAFSVENVSGESIECPLCGVVHDNSITSRASILADKSQAQQQLETIDEKVGKLKEKLETFKSQQELVRTQIAGLNTRFKDRTNSINLVDFVNGIASNTVQNKVQEQISVEFVEVASIEKEIKAKKSEQKALTTDEEREQVYSSFLKYLVRYLERLDARSISLSKVKTPLDYTILQKEGGAAEGSRAMLAYYLAIYSSIRDKPSTSIAPITIDTPNQHEQSHINYGKIVELILADIYSEETQLFLCAMENDDLARIRGKAKIFQLDGDKLLNKKMFDEIQNEFVEKGISRQSQPES